VIYCYRCSLGHTKEVNKPMSQSHTPETCEKCDRFMERDYQAEGASAATAKLANDIRGYPYVSSRLPRDLPGCKHDSLGKPIIMSKRHEREVMARHNLKRE
jgi:hypothetical protein